MKTRYSLIWLFIIIGPMTVYSDKASKLNKSGIEAYQENNHEESVRNFTEALVERPDSPELRFNRGTALSALGKSDEAINELERAANTFENKDRSAAAHFNAGNTHLRSGNLEDAIDEYKQAVKLDQLSEDIRHNLELALRQLNQQQKQQQENKEQNQENKENQDQQDENRDSSEQDSEKEKNEEQNQSKPSENQDREEKGDQEQPQPQESEQQPMSPEEAQRILDAMNDEEKQAFELRRMMMKEAMRPGDDW